MLFFGLKVSAKLNSALLPLAKFSSDAFHSLVFCHVFVSKRTLFILIGLVFLTISNFFSTSGFLVLYRKRCEAQLRLFTLR